MSCDHDPLEAESKSVYQDYLMSKYSNLYQNTHHTIDSFDFNLSSLKITNGQSNEIYLCQLINQCDLIDENDGKVIIRFFGSQLTGSGNIYKINAIKEKEIYDKVSESLKLPKILYTFPKGRIETFLELESINLDEFERYSSRVAKIISKVHSLNLSDIIQANEDHLHNVLSNLYKLYLDNLSNFNNLKFSDKTNKNFRELSSFDYEKIIDWAFHINKKINCKILFSHNDVNRYANYDYRWSDLSNYLIELTIGKASQQEKQTIDNFLPDDKFCSEFLINYLEYLKKNNAYNFTESEDNLKTLRREVDFGCIMVNLIRLLWILGLPHDKLNKFEFWKDAYFRYNLMKKLYQKFFINNSKLL